jgi:hypothetical protein
MPLQHQGTRGPCNWKASKATLNTVQVSWAAKSNSWCSGYVF